MITVKNFFWFDILILILLRRKNLPYIHIVFFKSSNIHSQVMAFKWAEPGGQEFYQEQKAGREKKRPFSWNYSVPFSRGSLADLKGTVQSQV